MYLPLRVTRPSTHTGMAQDQIDEYQPRGDYSSVLIIVHVGHVYTGQLVREPCEKGITTTTTTTTTTLGEEAERGLDHLMRRLLFSAGNTILG